MLLVVVVAVLVPIIYKLEKLKLEKPKFCGVQICVFYYLLLLLLLFPASKPPSEYRGYRIVEGR